MVASEQTSSRHSARFETDCCVALAVPDAIGPRATPSFRCSLSARARGSCLAAVHPEPSRAGSKDSAAGHAAALGSYDCVRRRAPVKLASVGFGAAVRGRGAAKAQELRCRLPRRLWAAPQLLPTAVRSPTHLLSRPTALPLGHAPGQRGRTALASCSPGSPAHGAVRSVVGASSGCVSAAPG